MHEIYLRSAKNFAIGFLVTLVAVIGSLVFSGIIIIQVLPVTWLVWVLVVAIPALFGCLNAMET